MNRRLELKNWTFEESREKSLNPTSRETLNQTAGNSITLFCDVESHPPPMIKWFINDKEIRGNINGIYFSDNNRRLIINEVAVEDIGDYVCEATNKAGSDRHLYKAGFVIVKIFYFFWVIKKKKQKFCGDRNFMAWTIFFNFQNAEW